jgi:hypothetical protein
MHQKHFSSEQLKKIATGRESNKRGEHYFPLISNAPIELNTLLQSEYRKNKLKLLKHVKKGDMTKQESKGISAMNAWRVAKKAGWSQVEKPMKVWTKKAEEQKKYLLSPTAATVLEAGKTRMARILEDTAIGTAVALGSTGILNEVHKKAQARKQRMKKYSEPGLFSKTVGGLAHGAEKVVTGTAKMPLWKVGALAGGGYLGVKAVKKLKERRRKYNLWGKGWGMPEKEQRKEINPIKEYDPNYVPPNPIPEPDDKLEKGLWRLKNETRIKEWKAEHGPMPIPITRKVSKLAPDDKRKMTVTSHSVSHDLPWRPNFVEPKYAEEAMGRDAKHAEAFIDFRPSIETTSLAPHAPIKIPFMTRLKTTIPRGIATKVLLPIGVAGGLGVAGMGLGKLLAHTNKKTHHWKGFPEITVDDTELKRAYKLGRTVAYWMRKGFSRGDVEREIMKYEQFTVEGTPVKGKAGWMDKVGKVAGPLGNIAMVGMIGSAMAQPMLEARRRKKEEKRQQQAQGYALHNPYAVEMGALGVPTVSREELRSLVGMHEILPGVVAKKLKLNKTTAALHEVTAPLVKEIAALNAKPRTPWATAALIGGPPVAAVATEEVLRRKRKKGLHKYALYGAPISDLVDKTGIKLVGNEEFMLTKAMRQERHAKAVMRRLKQLAGASVVAAGVPIAVHEGKKAKLRHAEKRIMGYSIKTAIAGWQAGQMHAEQEAKGEVKPLGAAGTAWKSWLHGPMFMMARQRKLEQIMQTNEPARQALMAHLAKDPQVKKMLDKMKQEGQLDAQAS